MISSRLFTACLLACLLLLAASSVSAQEKNSENTLKLAPGASSPKASLADMGWLSGYWRGPGFDGDCEEAWGPALGDRMLGWFSLRQSDKLVFSEAMALVEQEGSLVVWIKHFNADFSGWEEKDQFVSFPLVRLGENEAFFNGLTYRRVDAQTLEIYVVVSSDGGEKEYRFELKRSEL